MAKTDTLGELPRVGRVVPELGSEAIRELSLYSKIGSLIPGNNLIKGFSSR